VRPAVAGLTFVPSLWQDFYSPGSPEPAFVVARGIRGLIRWWSDSWSTRWSTTRSRRCATAPGYVGRCRIWKPSPCMERLADLAALRCDRGL